MIALNTTQSHKVFNGMTNTVNVGPDVDTIVILQSLLLTKPHNWPRIWLICIHVMQTFKETIYFNFFTMIPIKFDLSMSQNQK